MNGIIVQNTSKSDRYSEYSLFHGGMFLRYLHHYRQHIDLFIILLANLFNKLSEIEYILYFVRAVIGRHLRSVLF